MPETITLPSNTSVCGDFEGFESLEFTISKSSKPSKPQTKVKGQKRAKENIDRDLVRRLFGPDRAEGYRG